MGPHSRSVDNRRPWLGVRWRPPIRTAGSSAQLSLTTLVCMQRPPGRARADGASASQDLSSTVQVTGASAIREERTLQYLVIESSTARAALACVVPGAVMVKCRMAEARRRGVAATRCASIITWSALTGVRCFCSIVTTSVDAQVAMDASSTSKGPGAVVASPSIRILGPRGRPAWNSRPRTHSTSIAAACGTVADCDFDIRFNGSVRAQRSSVCALPMPRVQTTALRAAILTLPTAASWAFTAVRRFWQRHSRAFDCAGSNGGEPAGQRQIWRPTRSSRARRCRGPH